MTSPALAQEQPDGSRAYVNPRTGEMVPSVTTVIDMYAKPKLTMWAAGQAANCMTDEWESLQEMTPWERHKMVKAAHERERDRSAALGTAVHAAMDAWAKGEAHDHPKEVDPYLNSFTRFLMDKRPTFIRSEVTTWNRTHNYAGTADAIVSLEGFTWLIDYKTGKNLHPEVGMQLSALAHGEFIVNPDGSEEDMPLINMLAAVHIRPRSWHFVPVNCDAENFRAFLAARVLHEWSTETAEKVLA